MIEQRQDIGLVESGKILVMGKLHKIIKGEHRRIYETFFGKIPNGFHIHHIDGNPLNNSIDNLICISKEEHCKIHKNEFILWANKGGELGGKKCVDNNLGFFAKTKEERFEQAKKAIILANSKDSIDKRSNTYKKRYSEKEIEHWTKKYSLEEISNMIKLGDPGKGMRGKESKHKGKKLKIKDLELANYNKSKAALNRKKYPCNNCDKEFDAGNLVRHQKSCRKW
jgi:hypothetical protein